MAVQFFTQRDGGGCLVTCLSTDTKPSYGTNDTWLLLETDTGARFKRQGSAWVNAETGGASSWGSITGTLSSQGDLQTALDAKSATSHNHDGSYSPLGHTHSSSEAFPVGSVFIAVVGTNPATLLGYGTWSAFGAGRMPVGFNSGDADFDTAEETGGAKTHMLVTSELPAHNHAITDPGHTHITQRYPTATGGSSGFTADTSMSGTLADNTLSTKSATTGITTQNAGSGAAHNNMPPYIVVYMWKRTA